MYAYLWNVIVILEDNHFEAEVICSKRTELRPLMSSEALLLESNTALQSNQRFGHV